MSKVKCPGCGKELAPTKSGRYRKHGGGDCDFSEAVIQEEECSDSTSVARSPTATSATSSQVGATESARGATPGTPSSSLSQEREGGASMTARVTDVIPGVDQYGEELNDLATTQQAEYRARVDAKLKTGFAQPAPLDYEEPPLFSQPADHWDPEVARDVPAFSQPAGRKSEEPPVPMTAEAGEIAARLKELFYAYDNRKSADNRSAQVTMGPSEMGTPCDRRLALSIMRMPPVNPGGDGWAAFVGTCIHAGLEEMFLWADSGTGRFAVEQRLEFGNVYVPKGTADLIDRVLLMVLDHKCQGRWSRNKLKTQGPSPTYKVQAHVYAYGARLRGEKIEKIAIVSWPRDEATLDDLYVHVEDYNPLIAKRAFERVEEIGAETAAKYEALDAAASEQGEVTPEKVLQLKATVAADFNVADDCRFCPFFLPNARDITRGCNGKR